MGPTSVASQEPACPLACPGGRNRICRAACAIRRRWSRLLEAQRKRRPQPDDSLRDLTAIKPTPQSVAVLAKPVRDRDRAHLKYVLGQPCLVCADTVRRSPCQVCRKLGRKVSDRFTVPLCRLHHRELHRRGSERAWWQQKAIDPLDVAKALWEKTHPLIAAAEPTNVATSGSDQASLADTSQAQNDKPIAGPRTQ